jgi:hypothetical protein
MLMRTVATSLAIVAACGPRSSHRDTFEPRTAAGAPVGGLTACGGSLSLMGDWEKETTGELVAKGPVSSVERIEYGIRVGLGEGRSFAIGLAPELTSPIAVGDSLDVSIRCQPIGWNALACLGTVLGADGHVIAFNTASAATANWKIERGPLLERWVPRDYGPTSTYGLRFTHDGATVVSPSRGCAELRTKNGTFRVTGTETVHADPRAPDSADTLSYDVIRVP